MLAVRIEISEAILKDLVCKYLEEQLGSLEVDKSKIEIQVKSKQNYKSEWEEAAFKAVYSHNKMRL